MGSIAAIGAPPFRSKASTKRGRFNFLLLDEGMRADHPRLVIVCIPVSSSKQVFRPIVSALALLLPCLSGTCDLAGTVVKIFVNFNAMGQVYELDFHQM